MGRTITALGLKFLGIWVVLSLFGLATWLPAGKAAAMALVTAILSYLADRGLPFRMQGVTRWAIDSGLAAFSIYVSQFLVPGNNIGFFAALVAGFLVGAVEIPLHFFLASRFGLRQKDDQKDGIR